MSGTLLRAHAATALRRVCGVAALLGLFAMHGLAVHGAMHAHAADPVPAIVAGHSHGLGDVAGAETRGDSPAGASQERGSGPELLGFAGVCLAILLACAVVALLSSRLVRLLRRPDIVTDPGRPSRSRRDRDPPCLFALSIQRC